MTALAEIPTLTTKRLVLRGFEPSDYPAYRAYYTAPARTGGVGGPVEPHRAFERFAGMIGQWVMMGFGRFAVTLEGKAIGHVGPLQAGEDSMLEMTWTLWDAGQTGKGYATEAARSVLQHLFDKGWGPIPAHIHPQNTASLLVARRLGGVEDSNPKRPAYLAGTRRFVLSPETLT